MAKQPTAADREDARTLDPNAPPSLREKAWGLRLVGWSHSHCLAVAFATREDHHTAMTHSAAYAEQEDPYAHGLIPPFSTPPAGRRRQTVPVIDLFARYRAV